MFVKINKTIVFSMLCVVLALAALSLSLMPAGNVAQAGPMHSPLPTVPAPPSGRGCVAPNGATIRKGPGSNFSAVGSIPAGGRFSPRAHGNHAGRRGWVYGTSSYGRGWVARALLSCK